MSDIEGFECKYNKFGFSKYRDQCRRLHYTEKCNNLAACSDIKRCLKMHPKACKPYLLERFCRFGNMEKWNVQSMVKSSKLQLTYKCTLMTAKRNMQRSITRMIRQRKTNLVLFVRKISQQWPSYVNTFRKSMWMKRKHLIVTLLTIRYFKLKKRKHKLSRTILTN